MPVSIHCIEKDKSSSTSDRNFMYRATFCEVLKEIKELLREPKIYEWIFKIPFLWKILLFHVIGWYFVVLKC